MALKFTASYLEDSITLFRHYKKLAERAMEQLSEDQIYASLDPEMNSIAVIIKHMSGNMRSRWTDFLITDGEKPERNRDSEFLEPPRTRSELMALWENGWNCVFAALEPLSEDDLPKSVTIRGEVHSVTQAVNRQLAHYSYHCGQIVFLAKHLASTNWQSLTIPRNRSAEFNQRVQPGDIGQR